MAMAAVQMMSARQSNATINLRLHPKQSEALLSKATELLYGGAAGGGKSHFSRVASILWCAEIPGLQVYFFRRNYDELIKNHMEGPSGFRALLAPWVLNKWVQIVETEIRFWNGSKIFLCHCQHEKNRYDYQGPEFHVLFIEEATQFTETILRYLRHRVRMPAIMKQRLPGKYQGAFPRIVYTSNPGGVGHHYIKEAFIDPRPPYQIERVAKKEGGHTRQYIPAKLEDNPSIDTEEYEGNLEGMGSAEQVRAIRHGDWNVVTGAFFDITAQHVIEPVILPDYWTRFGAFDWGSARPFSYGWYAVAGDEFEPRIPRNSLIKYREWYGCSGPNVGLKLTAEQVAAGILERETLQETQTVAYRVADTQIFEEDGGPSIAERMRLSGVAFRRADKRRIPGHEQVRSRLKGEDGKPMLYFFNTCRHTIRTIPILQHDELKPEDLDTEGEDHSYDETRYACMSRPYAEPKPKQKEPIRGIANTTLNELFEKEKRLARMEKRRKFK